VRAAFLAAVLAAVLAAAVTLTGCGPAGGGTGNRPATPTAPADGPAGADPADVREMENIVNDLDGVVGSAEAEAEAETASD
jgi:hypothetical protein